MPNTDARSASLDRPQSLAPQTLVDTFEVERLVAEGAMGEVYLAHDRVLGRKVALKLLRPEVVAADAVERFLAEMRLTARFSHPHIVSVYAAGTHAGRPYVALEYLGGEPLRARLDRGPLPVIEALGLVRAIAAALAEAHRHGIVHADLKPDNVVVPSDGRLRVVDFGLARAAGAERVLASGTPAYMAPECWLGKPPSTAIDVWSLGVIARELLEGKRPISDEALAAFAFAPKPVEPGRLTELGDCGAVLARCLAPAPSDRPTAEEIALAVSSWLDVAQPRLAGPPPFRGLRAFTESDAAEFFGREDELLAFEELLRQESLVALIGPSGIGKSSFLRAGVVPRLRRSNELQLVELRPGDRPLSRLAAAVLGPSVGVQETQQLAADLRKAPTVLAELLGRRTGRVMVVVDAFEELFTLAPPEEAEAFAACLRSCADLGPRFRVVIALRDDYLGRLAQIPALRSFLRGCFVLGPLSAARMEAAISGPLRRAGFRPEPPELIQRIVADAGHTSAALPLLQFTCAALWEVRDVAARTLRAEAYDAIGGVAGALAGHADRSLAELPQDQARVARTLLLRLVTAEGTRRVRSATELLEGLPPSASQVLDRLVSARLLTATRDVLTDAQAIELAHESLVRTWPTLARWIQETREELVLLRELEEATALWERRGRRDEETWSADGLALARARIAQGSVSLPEGPRAFLEAGERRHQRAMRSRRALLAGSFVALGTLAAAAGVAALQFRARQLEAIRQQEQIRLASADVGRFELVIAPYDFDPSTNKWVPSKRGPDAPPLQWKLSPALPSTGEQSPSWAREQGRWESDGAWHQTIEAPSRPSVLEIERPGCSPSLISIRRLPGYQERGKQQQVRVDVPSCAASEATLVSVPGGPYWQRQLDGSDVQVNVPVFGIDRTEVTNGQLSLFARQASLTGFERQWPPRGPHAFDHAHDPNAPVTGIDAFDAEAFCEFMGKELPTLDEWRKSFRGGLWLDAEGKVPNPDPLRHTVWSGDKGEAAANLGGSDSFPGMAPVGSFPEDRSPYGILDLAGNVAEWTRSEAIDPQFSGMRLAAGGTWDIPPNIGHQEVDWVNNLPPRRFDFSLGLRCVAHPKPTGSFK